MLEGFTPELTTWAQGRFTIEFVILVAGIHKIMNEFAHHNLVIPRLGFKGMIMCIPVNAIEGGIQPMMFLL